MAESFSAQMKSFANMTEDKALKVFKRTCLDIGASIIKDTAVDTGRARINWQPEINTFPSSNVLGAEKNAGAGKNRVREKTNALNLGDSFTLTNNLDYISKLEFGLYPNPSKNGNLTENGYSKKSPAGMVRINLLRFQSILNIANKEIK